MTGVQTCALPISERTRGSLVLSGSLWFSLDGNQFSFWSSPKYRTNASKPSFSEDTVARSARAAMAPAPGIEISKTDRAFLDVQTQKLAAAMAEVKGPANRQFLPDVRIFHNAVRYALDDNMFYKPEDVKSARKLLELGRERADQLKKGKHPWTRATGLLVRGYRSHIDDSVIPYGVDVPKNFNPNRRGQMRLDIWLHGRNNILSEIRFLTERLKRSSQFRPGNTIVLHPYGRFCNAYKFAGEVDVLESLDHVDRKSTRLNSSHKPTS